MKAEVFYFSNFKKNVGYKWLQVWPGKNIFSKNKKKINTFVKKTIEGILGEGTNKLKNLPLSLPYGKFHSQRNLIKEKRILQLSYALSSIKKY